ncbi:MAG TPA: hypothetical protein DIU15_20745, partial [Deltaproteobacteria bacterium]|nr:hypothetical protein [Deltaproteobacteria bacterium]
DSGDDDDDGDDGDIGPGPGEPGFDPYLHLDVAPGCLIECSTGSSSAGGSRARTQPTTSWALLLIVLFSLRGRRRDRWLQVRSPRPTSKGSHGSNRLYPLLVMGGFFAGQVPAAGQAETETSSQEGSASEDTGDDTDPDDAPPSNEPEGSSPEVTSDETEQGEPPPSDEPEVDPAQTAALAHETHQEHCANLVAGDNLQAADAILAVTPVWRQVTEVHSATSESYLVYWSGMLSLCLGQERRGAEDLQQFLDLEKDNSQFTMLVRDAERRLRRLGITSAKPNSLRPGAESTDRSKAVSVALGAGYQGLFQPAGEQSIYHYGALAVDVSIKLVGPLRLDVQARPALSGRAQPRQGDSNDNVRSLLWAFAVGPELQFDGPVRPRVGLVLQLAPNPNGSQGGPVLVGAALGGGVDIPLGSSPLAVRVTGEVGGMSSEGDDVAVHMITLRGLSQLVVAFGP